MESKYGINQLSVIAGRLEPSSKSEMTTQILFGETYQIIDTHNNWLKIKLDTDNYECWINHLQHFSISESTYQEIKQHPIHINAELIQLIQSGKNYHIVPLGAQFPLYQNNQFRIDNTIYEAYGKTIILNPSTKTYNGKACVEYAMMFLNAPYLWGGKTIMGIDCSGFVQICCAMSGYLLPRDAKDQVHHGVSISFLDEVQPGDIAFFHNEEGHIIHTGIMINSEHIIHASGKVKINKIDHYGIFSPELKTHSHHLRVIKRLP